MEFKLTRYKHITSTLQAHYKHITSTLQAQACIATHFSHSQSICIKNAKFQSVYYNLIYKNSIFNYTFN